MTRSDGLPVPEDVEERLLTLLDDSPLSDAPFTPDEERALARLEVSHAAHA